MRNYLVYSVLAMAFLQVQTAHMGGMPAFMKMKNVLKPFGCLDLTPGKDFVQINLQCMTKMIGEFVANTGDGDVELPPLKQILEDFTKCRLEQTDFVVGDTFSIENFHTKLLSPDTFLRSNEEDMARLKEIMDECKDLKADEISTQEPFLGALTLESCHVKLAMEKCTEWEGSDSYGVMLPMIYALNSVVVPNERCDLVVPPKEPREKYEQCLKDELAESSSSEEDLSSEPEGIFPDMGSPMKKMMKVFMNFHKIPEIECMIKVSEDYDILEDGRTDYSAVADWVSQLEGWEEEARDLVVTQIRECAAKAKNGPNWERDLEVAACFLPLYADTCGLDNDLTREVLIPMTDSELMSSIFNSIRKKFEIPDLLKRFRF